MAQNSGANQKSHKQILPQQTAATPSARSKDRYALKKTLSNEQIVDDTYGPNQPLSDNQNNNNKNKKTKFTEDQTQDENMYEATSSPALHVADISNDASADQINMENQAKTTRQPVEGLGASIHAPVKDTDVNMDSEESQVSSREQDNQQLKENPARKSKLDTGLPNKSNPFQPIYKRSSEPHNTNNNYGNTATDTPSKGNGIEVDHREIPTESNIHGSIIPNEVTYACFFTQTDFKEYKDTQIRLDLQEYFSADEHFVKVTFFEGAYTDFFIVHFASEKSRNKYVNKPIAGLLNAKPKLYKDESSIEEMDILFKEHIDACTIILERVPSIYKLDVITRFFLKHDNIRIINEVDKNLNFIKQESDFTKNRQGHRTQNKAALKSLLEKNYMIIFESNKIPQTIEQHKKYAMRLYEHDIFIFPLNGYKEKRTQVRESQYKITGIPFDCKAETLKHIGDIYDAHAIIFPQFITRNNRIINSNIANIYIPKEKWEENHKNMIKVDNLMVYISHNHKTCFTCGNPDHEKLQCDHPTPIRRINQTKLLSNKRINTFSNKSIKIAQNTDSEEANNDQATPTYVQSTEIAADTIYNNRRLANIKRYINQPAPLWDKIYQNKQSILEPKTANEGNKDKTSVLKKQRIAYTNASVMSTASNFPKENTSANNTHPPAQEELFNLRQSINKYEKLLKDQNDLVKHLTKELVDINQRVKNLEQVSTELDKRVATNETNNVKFGEKINFILEQNKNLQNVQETSFAGIMTKLEELIFKQNQNRTGSPVEFYNQGNAPHPSSPSSTLTIGSSTPSINYREHNELGRQSPNKLESPNGKSQRQWTQLTSDNVTNSSEYENISQIINRNAYKPDSAFDTESNVANEYNQSYVDTDNDTFITPASEEDRNTNQYVGENSNNGSYFGKFWNK